MAVLLKRQHIRLAGYDYSRVGAYFVTLCAVDRKRLFGEIVADEMRLSQIGSVVVSSWGEIPKHFPNVTPDEFVVMPNHLHGILLLGDVEAGHARLLPVIVGSFKSAVSRLAGFPIWQRSYWDRIIRSEAELNQARRYIEENPFRWSTDP
jgi:REP element-mobilizing transposase RayT